MLYLKDKNDAIYNINIADETLYDDTEKELKDLLDKNLKKERVEYTHQERKEDCVFKVEVIKNEDNNDYRRKTYVYIMG